MVPRNLTVWWVQGNLRIHHQTNRFLVWLQSCLSLRILLTPGEISWKNWDFIRFHQLYKGKFSALHKNWWSQLQKGWRKIFCLGLEITQNRQKGWKSVKLQQSKKQHGTIELIKSNLSNDSDEIEFIVSKFEWFWQLCDLCETSCIEIRRAVKQKETKCDKRSLWSILYKVNWNNDQGFWNIREEEWVLQDSPTVICKIQPHTFASNLFTNGQNLFDSSNFQKSDIKMPSFPILHRKTYHTGRTSYWRLVISLEII